MERYIARISSEDPKPFDKAVDDFVEYTRRQLSTITEGAETGVGEAYVLAAVRAAAWLRIKREFGDPPVLSVEFDMIDGEII